MKAAMKDSGNMHRKKRKRMSTCGGRHHRQEGVDSPCNTDHGSTNTPIDIHSVNTASGASQKKAKRRKKERKGRSVGVAAAAALVSTSSTQNRLPGLPPSCTSKVDEYEAGGSAETSTASVEVREATGRKERLKKSNIKKRQSSSRREGDASLSRDPAEVGVRDDNGVNDAANDDEVAREETFEGIMHEGAMYLVDSRKRVFSAKRNERGDPVQVGIVDQHRVVVLQASPSKVAVAFVAAASPKATAKIPMCYDKAAPRDAVKNETKPAKKRKKNKRKSSVGTKETAAAVGGSEGGGDNGETESSGAQMTTGKCRVLKEKPSKVVEYPFEVEECDHCETSERAFADIVPLLMALAGELGKTPEELSIYDPYYCQGSTVGRLAALGFPRVYNRKEDFYEVLSNDQVPEHDVLVTNPPFSGDHVPSILRFCARRGAKPWFLLLPNFVYLKDYYESSLTSGSGRGPALPFYLTPPKRYMFYSPQGSRLSIKSSERKTSPFNTFWYIRLGDAAMTSKVMKAFEAGLRPSESLARCRIARNSSQIPYKMMDSNDPRRKKARDRQRSIERIRIKKSAWIAP